MSEPKTRKLELEVELDAPPDVVWRMVTESDRLTRWFAPEAKVEPGAGGTIWLSWGPPMEGTAPITIWEPGRRFGWTEGAESPKVAEFIIEAREGGKTVLHLVQSGFGSGAAFDDEYDSVHGGWRTFFAVLQHMVKRHAEGPGATVNRTRMLGLRAEDGWKALLGAAGIGDLSEGAEVTASLPGARPFRARVHRVIKAGYAVFTLPEFDDSVLALFCEGKDQSIISITWYLYGAGAPRGDEARRIADAWIEKITPAEPAG